MQQNKIWRQVAESPYDNNLAVLGDRFKLWIEELIHQDTEYSRQIHR